jgi:putative SOS response-associated peptidase YedK
MCGRYSFTKKELRFVSKFSPGELRLFLQQQFNIAPTQTVPVIHVLGGALVKRDLRWGLQPPWSKAPIINAQCETLLQKPTFRDAFLHRRSLVPSDGFYEWRGKAPFRFVMPNEEPFYFATVWETWRKSATEQVDCFCIVTTEANTVVAPYHKRMPFIVEPNDYDTWLDPMTSEDVLTGILNRPGSQRMEVYEVSSFVNKASNEDPKCVEAVASLGLG